MKEEGNEVSWKGKKGGTKTGGTKGEKWKK
jgi:hypothetical protein